MPREPQKKVGLGGGAHLTRAEGNRLEGCEAGLVICRKRISEIVVQTVG